MIDVPQFSSPYEAFAAMAAQRASAPFLSIPSSARNDEAAVDISYGEMLGNIQNLSEIYKRAGYGAGQRVGILLENDPKFLSHFFALNSLGASIVPINPDYRPAEAAYVVEHGKVDLIVAFDRYRRLLVLANVACEVVDEHLSNLQSRAEPEEQPFVASRDVECALLYTSGTTGKPKGCILKNEYFMLVGQNYLETGGLCDMEMWKERLVTPLPLFHMNALAVSTMAMVLSGGCLIQLDRFHPKTWWNDVRSTRATIAHYLGVMPAILLSLPESEDDKTHHLRFAFGANCDPKHQLTFEKRFGFPLIEAWAMTETAGAGTIAASCEPRLPGKRCIGKPTGPIQTRVVDAEDQDVGTGLPGELVVRYSEAMPRKGFFAGYLGDEPATEKAWKNGWFHTGDVVRQDELGNFYFVDRQKNIIRRSGENIAALEVEAVILELESVQQVAVLAAPDDIRDEEVLACVRLKDGARANEATALEIQNYCLENLSYFKAPGYVAFVDSLPTTATNKVQKTRLADFAVNPLKQPNCFDLRARKKREKTLPSSTTSTH